MRRWILPLALLAGSLALAACAAQETPKEEAKPAPAAPAAAPAAAAPAAKPAWEQEWERVLAAAKREGKVAVMGAAGTEARRVVESFEKKYGIAVEYLGGGGRDLAPRVKLERAAGQYLWDAHLGGLTSWIPRIEEWFVPIEPALILPEVKDPKNWWGGKLQLLGDKGTFLATSLTTTSLIAINPNLVKPQEFRSNKDLLDSKWKGKLLADDPSVGGAAAYQFAFLYHHPELGPDFVRSLILKQDVTITRDKRQQVEWLAHGRFPILLGGSRNMMVPLKKEGLLMQIDPTGLKEGSSMSGSNGYASLFSRAPHPNAAKVFINWLLAKEGHSAWARALGWPSLRLDVANDWVEPWELPQEGYMSLAGLDGAEMVAKSRKFTGGIIGR